MKRQLKTGLVLLLLIPLLGSCITDRINSTMNSWVGHPESELINSWGPPSTVYKMDDGSKVLTYNYKRDGYQEEGTAYKDQWGVVHYTDPQTTGGYTATRSFTVNPKGIIVSWRWQGM